MQRQGTIKIWHGGWGFIASNDENERDLFVTRGAIAGSDLRVPRPGDGVQYETARNGRGPCAIRVVFLEPAHDQYVEPEYSEE